MEHNEAECKIMQALGLYSSRHFTEDEFKTALAGMENEDGSTGAHFDLEECKKIMKDNPEIGEAGNSLYDFAYVINMIRSDYYGAVPDNDKTYTEMAKKFILDKDAPAGKAKIYYLAMKSGKQQAEGEKDGAFFY